MAQVAPTGVGEKTSLSGIMRLVATAQASGSRAQALADRAAAILFYVAVVAGAITFAYWWFSGDKEHALIRTATVSIIACPMPLDWRFRSSSQFRHRSVLKTGFLLRTDSHSKVRA